ncbi:hypothetical protein THAOC_36717 [Thalassiosira oceanica]|uniref:Uncharacterized protein n=1 Tax=Thalassiosira oceanica TaxID=159749 RepID=K0QZ48_THAOC|nr:hypothetical protein THAOC_36717 [Thalassiosira oceanica]|eukprot:EJK44723.1 hypothetical protein THAOC_36717 [Thalassiosira oceanica]
MYISQWQTLCARPSRAHSGRIRSGIVRMSRTINTLPECVCFVRTSSIIPAGVGYSTLVVPVAAESRQSRVESRPSRERVAANPRPTGPRAHGANQPPTALHSRVTTEGEKKGEGSEHVRGGIETCG